MKTNIIDQFQNTFRKYADRPALTDYTTGQTWTYLAVATRIAKYHTFFQNSGIKKGDKIAMMSENSSAFVTAYLAVVTYGAICVPILPGFSTVDAIAIINHSDARILLTDIKIWERLRDGAFDRIEGVYELSERQLLRSTSPAVDKAYNELEDAYKQRYPNGFKVEDIVYDKADDDATMIISYTSGTTGNSKGVMLSVDSITCNARFAQGKDLHYPGSQSLALLPMAHAFACAFDLFSPLSIGSHVTILGKTPSPAILVKALADVKPNMLCIVPLIIEKIVKGKVLPKLRTQPIATLLKIPGVNKLIYKKVRKQLLDTFGGNLREFEAGGAALDPEVERFLRKINFPYTVGYGMTECGPLISYDWAEEFVESSVGTIVPELVVKIVNPNSKGIGEVCVKGRHVMQGYYKNPEATAQAIDKDGWLHTGDMGFLRDGKNGKVVFLRGRCKTMILSADGQNIYPEEIEFKLNNLDFVSESFVFSENGTLVALVVPDFDRAKKENVSIDALRGLMKQNLEVLNSTVGSYERLKEIRLCSEAFEKTPKQSIKRALYPQNAKLL